MSIRFFADHCVPNSVIRFLLDQGHEVIKLRDCLLTDSSDKIVIDKSAQLNCILLTLNGDFADIIAYPPSIYNGIFALQVKNHPEILPQIMTRIVHYLSGHPDMNHYKGKLFLIEAHRIRIRE